MATQMQATTASGLNRRNRFLPDFGFSQLIQQGPSQELHQQLNNNSPFRLARLGLMSDRMARGIDLRGSQAQYGWDMEDFDGNPYQAMLEGSLWKGPDGVGGMTPSRPQASGDQMNQGLINPLMNLMQLFRQRRGMGL